MATKPKLSDFKRLIAEMTEAELREELLKLFKLEQVQQFYAQDLLSNEDRKKILNDTKDKIYKKFWTPSGNPRMNVSNADIRTLINNFEKISAFPYEVVELLLYRVETATNFADQYGGMPDADYNASINAYDKAMKLITKHNLENYFKETAKASFKYDNLDYWYIDELRNLYEACFGVRPPYR